MKIGILTYHRTLNYGGCLQALATRIILERMGHEAYYVDYWPRYHAKVYKVFRWDSFRKMNTKNKICYLRDQIRYAKTVSKFRNAFSDFHSKYTIPFCRQTNENFDAAIYGSDQIWRKQPNGDYNPVYFGDNNLKTDLHIAFSASMGNLPQNDTERNKVKELVSHLNCISVRENNLKTLLEELGYNDVQQTLDPTLCLTAATWDKEIQTESYIGKPYVLLFKLRGGFRDEDVREYAHSHGLELKTLRNTGLCKSTSEIVNTAGPADFLGLIKNASVIFTSSFHGLAFSLIYGKEVFASFNENGARGLSLMEMVGCKDHYLEPFAEIPADVSPIDYASVYDRLNAIKQETFSYLTKALSV